MNPNEAPDPGYVITIKDIYREAAAFARHDLSVVGLHFATAEQKERAIHDGLLFAQDLAQACGHPKHFTITQELRKTQDFMLAAYGMLEAVSQRVMTFDPETFTMEKVELEALKADIDAWLAEGAEELGIRHRTPEEMAAMEQQRKDFAEQTGQEPATGGLVSPDDSVEGNSIPFGAAK